MKHMHKREPTMIWVPNDYCFVSVRLRRFQFAMDEIFSRFVPTSKAPCPSIERLLLHGWETKKASHRQIPSCFFLAPHLHCRPAIVEAASPLPRPRRGRSIVAHGGGFVRICERRRNRGFIHQHNLPPRRAGTKIPLLSARDLYRCPERCQGCRKNSGQLLGYFVLESDLDAPYPAICKDTNCLARGVHPKKRQWVQICLHWSSNDLAPVLVAVNYAPPSQNSS